MPLNPFKKAQEKVEEVKGKIKAAPKNAVKKVVLGTSDQIFCAHCQRPRSRLQVNIWGSKSAKPLKFTCKDGASCRKARAKLTDGGTVKHRRGNKHHPGSLPINDD